MLLFIKILIFSFPLTWILILFPTLTFPLKVSSRSKTDYQNTFSMFDSAKDCRTEKSNLGVILDIIFLLFLAYLGLIYLKKLIMCQNLYNRKLIPGSHRQACKREKTSVALDRGVASLETLRRSSQ